MANVSLSEIRELVTQMNRYHGCGFSMFRRLCGVVDRMADETDDMDRLVDFLQDKERNPALVIFICEESGRPMFRDNMRSTNRGFVHEDHLDDYLYSEVVDEWIHTNDWDPERHDPDEQDNEDCDEDGLRGYSFDVMQTTRPFQKLDHEADTIWLGIEIEMEMRSGYDRMDAVEQSYDDLGSRYMVCKEDGSLEGGFEIVTTPCTLSYHRSKWDRFFENTARNMVKSYRTGTCGMHIHVGRDAFTPLTLGKFLVFYNSPKNRDFMERIAQRGNVHWSGYIDGKQLKHGATQWCEPEKYQSVNTGKANTIEVRIFKGNVARLGFFKNLEFVHASVEFCKQTSMKKLSHTDFVSWLLNPKVGCKYPHLLGWMSRNGMIQLPKNLSRKKVDRLQSEAA